MNDSEQIDEYLVASGTGGVSRRDLDLLATYAALNGAGYCQHGCGQCAASCPNGVEISEVLRTRMYDVDYGDRELARTDYAAIRGDASPCLGCTGTPCRAACPNGIPISDFTRDAVRRLA